MICISHFKAHVGKYKNIITQSYHAQNEIFSQTLQEKKSCFFPMWNLGIGTSYLCEKIAVLKQKKKD